MVVAGLRPETAVQIEAGFGASMRGHGDRIEVRTADKNVNPMLSAILDAGGQVLSVTPHRVSLESIFLSAVEKNRIDEGELDR